MVASVRAAQTQTACHNLPCFVAGGVFAGAVAGASSEPAVREACVKLPASFRQTGVCKGHPRAQSVRHLAVAHQSLPNSAESAHFSRVCQTPQSLPILARSFSFQRSLPISAKGKFSLLSISSYISSANCLLSLLSFNTSCQLEVTLLSTACC